MVYVGDTRGNFYAKLWECKSDANSNSERLLFTFVQSTHKYFAKTSPTGHSGELLKSRAGRNVWSIRTKKLKAPEIFIINHKIG